MRIIQSGFIICWSSPLQINKSALVVGAGIGGLTVSLCLAEKGFDVRIFEQTRELGEVGAGLQLSPNCSRVLHDLGLEKEILSKACLPDAAEIRDWKHGKLLSSMPLGDSAIEQYGFPYYHIHRADLLAILFEKAGKHPNIQITTSAKIEGCSQDTNGPGVSHNGERISADLLVGADGIHSEIRTALFGEEKPRYTGNVAWRGLIHVDQLPEDLKASIRPVAGLWWGPGKHFVHYYVRSRELINCVCVVEKKGWEVESWSERGDKAELVKDFEGWDHRITTLIDAMDPSQCFKWALFDRAPMTSWSRGNVGLLGDACHPSLPFLAQGAAMAIEDAAVLAACVQDGQIEAGLCKYELLRKDRATRIQNASRRNAKIFHLRGARAWARNQAVKFSPDNMLDWIYRYDALDSES